jgi:hypothetical protein
VIVGPIGTVAQRLSGVKERCGLVALRVVCIGKGLQEDGGVGGSVEGRLEVEDGFLVVPKLGLGRTLDQVLLNRSVDRIARVGGR